MRTLLFKQGTDVEEVKRYAAECGLTIKRINEKHGLKSYAVPMANKVKPGQIHTGFLMYEQRWKVAVIFKDIDSNIELLFKLRFG